MYSELLKTIINLGPHPFHIFYSISCQSNSLCGIASILLWAKVQIKLKRFENLEFNLFVISQNITSTKIIVNEV